MDKWEREYDLWKTRTPEDNEVIFCYCEYCDGEIYEGEEYWHVEDVSIHEDCFIDYIYKSFRPIKRTAGE